MKKKALALYRVFPLSFMEFTAVSSPVGWAFGIALALKWSVWLVIILTISAAIITVLILACVRLLNRVEILERTNIELTESLEEKEDEIQVINNERGQKAVELIGKAHQIYVTHFQENVPVGEYVDAMVNGLNGKELQVIRILPAGIDRSASPYDWLLKFEKCRENPECSYDEVEVSVKLPFDIAIYDDNRAVIMYSDFGVRRFTRALLFENKEVINMLKNCFEWLRQKEAESPSQSIGSGGQRS